MAVFERPARHRSRSGEAGGRYLKKNSTGFYSGQHLIQDNNLSVPVALPIRGE